MKYRFAQRGRRPDIHCEPEETTSSTTDSAAADWLAAFGLLVLFALAFAWIAVGIGMAGPNAEAAANSPQPLILLPLISSAFTPAIETLRGLLLGTHIGNNGWIAIAWCVGLNALGHRWSAAQFNRDPK